MSRDEYIGGIVIDPLYDGIVDSSTEEADVMDDDVDRRDGKTFEKHGKLVVPH